MWQSLTERAKRTVFHAQEAAQEFGEGYVSTEHLLLGILREPEGGGAQTLLALGTILELVEAEVEAQTLCGEPRSAKEMSLTPRGRRAFDLAADEALRLGHDQIGTEHLLLGLIRERDGVAGRVLASLGVSLTDARLAVTMSRPRYNSWARFDDPARAAILAAGKVAQAQGRAAISPDHLLLGLLDQAETIDLLKRLEVDPDALRAATERLSHALRPPSEKGLSYSPACYAAFLRAYAEQRALDAPKTGPAHLLLGLLLEPDGVAGRLLMEFGVEADRLREAIGAL